MTLLLLHFAATLFMTGLVWFVQAVHYPLMHRVGGSGFSRYEAEHTRRTSPVVAPMMLFELGSGIWLVLAPPPGVDVLLLLINVAVLAVIWGSTIVLQKPIHRDLEQGFTADVLDRLVSTNWIRTVSWSLRAVLLLYVLQTLAAVPLQPAPVTVPAAVKAAPSGPPIQVVQSP
ncbi:MAG: hypothetical protein O2782_16160 [bacterium]|nr:hypothetical protein [bacterium]